MHTRRNAALEKVAVKSKVIQRKSQNNSKATQKILINALGTTLNNENYTLPNIKLTGLPLKEFTIPLVKLIIDFKNHKKPSVLLQNIIEKNDSILKVGKEATKSLRSRRNLTNTLEINKNVIVQKSLKRKNNNENTNSITKLKKPNEVIPITNPNIQSLATRASLRQKAKIPPEKGVKNDIYEFNTQPSSNDEKERDDMELIKKLQKKGMVKIVKPKKVQSKKKVQAMASIWNNKDIMKNSSNQSKDATKKRKKIDKVIEPKTPLSQIKEKNCTVVTKQTELLNKSENLINSKTSSIENSVNKPPLKGGNNLKIQRQFSSISPINLVESIESPPPPPPLSPTLSLKSMLSMAQYNSRFSFSPLNLSNIENVDPIMKDLFVTSLNTQKPNPQRSPLKSLINNNQQLNSTSLRNSVLSNNANKMLTENGNQNSYQISKDAVFLNPFYNDNHNSYNKNNELENENIEYNVKNFFGFDDDLDDFDFLNNENNNKNVNNENSLKGVIKKLKKSATLPTNPMRKSKDTESLRTYVKKTQPEKKNERNKLTRQQKIDSFANRSPEQLFNINREMCSTMIEPMVISPSNNIRKRPQTDKIIKKNHKKIILDAANEKEAKLFDEPEMENVECIWKMPDDEIFKPLPRKQYKRKPVVDKELDSFIEEFNSMCDEVDSYKLIVE